jgi:hypothetical protein
MLCILCLCGMDWNEEPALTSIAITVYPVMDCRGGQCRNEWGECFEQTRDAEGIVNLDTMQPAECRVERKAVVARE